MASILTLELDALLNSIAEDSPVGIDLRKDLAANSTYYQIKDARNLARSLERRIMQGEPPDKDPNTEWEKVIHLAEEILYTQSKDLEICVWLIEGLLRKQGFAGLHKGFELTFALCEKYWETIYPQPDEEGIATRVAALTCLNGEEAEGTLIVPLANVPITLGKSCGPFALWQYNQAKQLNQILDPEKKAQLIEGGALDIKNIETAVSETDAQFFRGVIAELEACIVVYKKLTQFLDERCGESAPPSSRILERLNECFETVKFLGKEAIEKSDLLAMDADSVTDLGSPEASAASSLGGTDFKNIKHREDAFKILLKVADYFLTAEPHSPVSYLIQKVVRWGRLPLPGLLKELITDDRVRGESFVLSGIIEENKE